MLRFMFHFEQFSQTTIFSTLEYTRNASNNHYCHTRPKLRVIQTHFIGESLPCLYRIKTDCLVYNRLFDTIYNLKKVQRD